MSRQNDWREGRGFRNSGISRHRRGGRGSGSRGGSGGERGGWKAERPRSSFNEEKRPPGLRGKAIGLWYRDRNKQKKKDGDSEYKARPFPLELDDHCEIEIRRSLDNVKARPPEHLVRKYALMNRSEDTDTKMEPGSYNATTEKYSYLEESKFKTCFLNSITGSIEENLRRSIANSIALVGDPELDDRYLNELNSKNFSAHYEEMMKFRMKLPSFAKRDEIVQLVESNQVTVVSGETGCGKTTQVAQFILDHEIRKRVGSKCRILCTQPRRISAISVAERVADERDEPIGNYGSVGYQIRLERALPRSTGSILFCTTGILLQYMQTDPALSTVSHIIIDEIHERDTISDFAITILKDVLTKRKDLKLILMSATLNAERFSKYYNNCPMITIPGFTFPVTEYYLEDILEMTRYTLKPKKYGGGKGKGKDKCYVEFIEPHVRNLRHTNKYSRSTLDTLMNPEIEEVDVDLVFELIKHISFQSRSKDTGAILVFLTGWDRISNLHKRLTECGSFPADKFLIIPLHSMMPTATQKTIFNRPPPGVRKIVIATNIAETSITIDDIVYVIDCGKIKMKNFDVENNISTLKPEWVSLANARQRRGRAGRVQEGICYHLFSKAREMSLETYPLPEMLRTRLEEVILQAKILQLGHVKPFLQKVLDPPNPVAVDLSLNMLTSLNALDDDETLTPLGYHLAQLPLDPQTGKMILMGALFNCIDPIFSIAASLSFKDAFTIPLGKEDEVDSRKQELDMGRKSDHLVLAEAFSQWEQAEHEGWGYSYCQRNFLSRNTLCLLKDMKKQFAEYLYDMKFLDSRNHKANESNINSNNVALIRAIICAGLYPNIAVIKNVRMIKRIGKAVVMLRTAEDGKVLLHPKSVNSRASFFESKFLIYHLKLKSTNINLHDTSMVHPLPLIFFGRSMNTCIEDKNTVIELSNLIRFSMKPSTADLIKELRIRLDWILEQKISNPGVTDWSPDSDEGCILRAISKLITTEDRTLMEDDDDEDDSIYSE